MCCFRWCGRQLCLHNMPISGVNSTPRPTAVYASDPALPRRPQDSLPSCLLGFGRTRLSLASSFQLSYRTPHPACMGLSLSRGRHAILVVLCIPFFCSTRAASILPSRPHISIAVARSGGQGRRFFSAAEGLSLTDASTAAGCRRSGGWPRDDPRGACHWPRSIARTTLVFG